MIQINNLSFSYGKHKIINNATTSFEKGKFYAVIGKNGSGKTTLINCLSRLKKATGGEITVNNKNYCDISRIDFAKTVSLLPQGRNIPNIQVYDFVSSGRFPYTLLKALSKSDFKIIDNALCMTDTLEFSRKNLKSLSGGERQRVYLAMLLAQDTPYVLLDEPVTHLDIACEYRMMDMLCRLKTQNKCVIAVLHNLQTALKYADELKIIDGGKIVYEGDCYTAVQNGVINSVFGIKCHTVKIDSKDTYIFENI